MAPSLKKQTDLLLGVLHNLAETQGVEAFDNDTEISFYRKKYTVSHYVPKKRGSKKKSFDPAAYKKKSFDTLLEALTFAKEQKSYNAIQDEIPEE